MDNLLDEIPFVHHQGRAKHDPSPSSLYMYHGHGNGNGTAHGVFDMPSSSASSLRSPKYSSSSRSGSPENVWSAECPRLLDTFRSLNLAGSAATCDHTPETLHALSSVSSHSLMSFNTQYNNNRLRYYYSNNTSNSIQSASSSTTTRFLGDNEPFGVEDSFILQQMQFNSPRRISANAKESLEHDYWMEKEGSIYRLAKDQYGCRYLQKRFEEGRNIVDKIFNGVIEHVAELMVNPFGNYLTQKLLDVCSQEQRMAVVLILTSDPTKLVKICLDIHGTRSVQKFIETLETWQQVVLVVSALQPGILELIKDLNGNHVIQCCLASLPMVFNKFIFDAAIKHCAAIATHRYGCCVLQRCIDYARGEYRAKLIAEVCRNGLDLAQDAFGNYVVQFVIDLKDPLATSDLMSRFQGNFVNLSMQKFSSNVVEKCLKVLEGQNKAGIVAELLAVPHFDQLLQDPYANYVIQSALENSKGALHEALADAILPHATALRTNLYCKRIFSRAFLKK